MTRKNRRTQAPERLPSWRAVAGLTPMLSDYGARVSLALLCLVAAKAANVSIPVVLKELVDALDTSGSQLLVLPVGLLAGYGALRLASGAFAELRDGVFARVRYATMRRLSTRVLAHLHGLSLRYHLDRRTGAVARDLERGTRSLSSLMNALVFNIAPTLIEVALVAAIMLAAYPPRFALVTAATVAVYSLFTLKVTEWRMHFRHTMNRLDSDANNRAVDSLVNFETVKYFGNEALETRRYDETLRGWEDAAVNSQTSMALLNFGQGAIIAVGVTVIMAYAAAGVVEGSLTIGDLVMVNAFLLQLFIPLGFLGVIYRQLKYATADMALLFELLERRAEVRDLPDAAALRVTHGAIEFRQVSFGYSPQRRILEALDLHIAPGTRVAVVGASGAGKSTLVRLLFRFYDVDHGAIVIDGQDLRHVRQASLREAIGIVPQDAVLFNDSIYYNIAYARPGATAEAVRSAARAARIESFIDSLPQGFDTVVGERGLKLSGGEKQRVAIARVFLKDPPILILDEATSALDSHSERAVQDSLDLAARSRTTLVIAHRLSTVVDADEILVMDGGRIVERGRHAALLRADGRYASLWHAQASARHSRPVAAPD